jgi:hypothetical protein
LSRSVESLGGGAGIAAKSFARVRGRFHGVDGLCELGTGESLALRDVKRILELLHFALELLGQDSAAFEGELGRAPFTGHSGGFSEGAKPHAKNQKKPGA